MSNVFQLREHIARQPIMDGPYERHLRTADIFNEVSDARRDLEQARKRYEAARAKAALIASMEIL
jgi:hypothetical protein